MSMLSFDGLLDSDSRGKAGVGLKKDADGRLVVIGLVSGGPSEKAGIIVGKASSVCTAVCQREARRVWCFDASDLPTSCQKSGTLRN